MNDNELITVLREQRDHVSMDTPVEQIISRGRAVRARRRAGGAAAVLGTAAATAFAVTAALAAGQPATAKLAAWTVTSQPGGGIEVTISELRDPAGLQRTLRADGVPASVTFGGQPNPACQGYPFGGDQSQRRELLGSVVTGPRGRDNAMTIHPAALPSGAGLQISALFLDHQGGRSFAGLSVGLVQVSPQCTGS